jgi:EthD domain
MSIKLILLGKRRPGLSQAEFRQTYESGHALLALRMFGHLYSRYRRNYLTTLNSLEGAGGAPSGPEAGEAGVGLPCDVVTEVTFPDQAALDQSLVIYREHVEELDADEETIYDRPSSWLGIADTVEEETGGSPDPASEPVRLFLLAKRKQGLSHDEFRRAYDNGHAQLALGLFRGFWSEYRRNYLSTANSLAGSGGAPSGTDAGGERDLPWDAISEIVFPNRAALTDSREVQRAHVEEIIADEETTFDRPSSWLGIAETIETDLSTAVAAAGNPHT